MVAQNRKSVRLKPSKAVGERLSALLDEIRLAVTWSRPSILLAAHHSKHGQEKAMQFLEGMLTDLSMKVSRVMPITNQSLLLDDILQRAKPEENIFFVSGLGTRNELYDELNLHRETIVENRLKMIFWLTTDELIALSRRAPDFWAFRHKAIEFPAGRARAYALPTGILLWRADDSFPEFDSLDNKISMQEKALQGLPRVNESALARAEEMYKLARLYWLKGETQKAEDILRHELDDMSSSELNAMKALLFNGLAICRYDRGDYKDAFRLMEKALELRPDHGCLWINYGVVCRAADRSAKSPPSVKKAIRLDPASSAFHGVLGYMLMSKGKFNAALSPLEEALRIDPDRVPYQIALAICHLKNGDVDRFEKTMQAIPDADAYVSICREGLMGERVVALDQLTDFVKDEKSLRAFARRDPNLFFIFGADALAMLQPEASIGQ